MPYLKAAGKVDQCCTEDNRCRPNAPCPLCAANVHLTQEDWHLIRFFHLVAGQYTNHAPMGTGEGEPPALTLRIEAVTLTLETYNYPRSMWARLIEDANTLFRLFHGIDKIVWELELHKHQRDVRPEDVRDE